MIDTKENYKIDMASYLAEKADELADCTTQELEELLERCFDIEPEMEDVEPEVLMVLLCECLEDLQDEELAEFDSTVNDFLLTR